MKNKIVLFFLATVFFICNAQAAIIDVPADYSTIQAAINAAENGDTVFVANGEYFENINLKGKNIVLTSAFYASGDYADIESTIINGSDAAGSDTASTILIISGENADCIVQGFTITGGSGTVWVDEHGAGTFREGGGFLIQYASPVIRFNIITGNYVNNNTGVISTGGGGLRCGDSKVQIKNNIIMNNEGHGYGGGIVINYCDSAVMNNNVIAYNEGGANYGGGGIWMTGSSSAQHIFIYNNTITKNSASGSGTFGGKGGGVFIFSVTAELRNNIIWQNEQVSGSPIFNSGGVLHTAYCDIDAAITGEGNINADPVFLDTVLCFLTDPLSPVIDAGDPVASYNDPASDSIVGGAIYPSLGTIVNDMGVYGGPERRQITDCPGLIADVISEPGEQGITIFPNPASTYIIVNKKNTAAVSFYLYDNFGHLLTAKKECDHTQMISLQAFPAGTYYFRIDEDFAVARSGLLMIK